MKRHPYWFFVLGLLILTVSGSYRAPKENRLHHQPKHAGSVTIESSFSLPDLAVETSGLLLFRNLVWTFNDSGGEPEIYGYSTADSAIRQRITIWNGYNFDWEDITGDSANIYIGDIGNNFGNRNNLCIYKVKKMLITKKANGAVHAAKIFYTYPGYKPNLLSFHRSDFDCEAMIWHNDSIFLFTKEWLSNKTSIYRLPDEPGKYIAEKIGEFNANGLITAADFDGKQLVLLGYKNYHSFLWKFKTKGNFSNLDERKATYIHLKPLDGEQTEGIAIINKNEYFISAERTKTTAKLWKVRINE